MLVLCLETTFSLFLKNKQNPKTCTCVILTLSRARTFSLIMHKLFASKHTNTQAPKLPKNSELHHKPPLLHILNKNFKLPFYSCVSWPFASKSFQTSYISPLYPCYPTVTPSSPTSIFINKALHLDFSRPFQPPIAQAKHCIRDRKSVV